MAKYRGPRLRIVRRIGRIDSFTRKTVRRNTIPGQHGAVRNKSTQFAYRLVEKQKLRFSYGISEKQTRRYVTRAQKIKGPTGAILLQILEIRLDNIVYRLGLAKTVPSARQWINHKHILVDKKCVRAPGFSCTPGQVITVKATKNIRRLLEQNLGARTLSVPSHLSLDLIRISGIVSGKIVRRELHFDLKELLVLEYYSNRL